MGSTDNLNDNNKKEEIRRSGRPQIKEPGREPVARQRFEEILRNSESFLNSIINKSSYPMWIADDQGTLVWLNQACRDLLRLTDAEVVGKYNILQDNVVEEQGLLPLVRQVFEEGETVRFEIKYDSSQLNKLQFQQTAVVILDVTMFPIMDAKGRITHAVIQHIDITERKRAEEAVQHSERRFRALIENSPDAIVLFGEDGRILYGSPSTTRLLGYDLQEFEGMDGFHFVHPEDLPASKALFNEILEKPGETRSFIFRILHKDGSWRYLEGNYTNLLADPSVGAIVNNYRDVTARKLAEEARESSEKKYRSFYQSILDGFVSVDMHGNILEANPSYLKMLGYTADEIRGLRYQDITPPQWHEYEAGIVEQQILPRGHSDTYEKEYIRKDGTVFPVELRTYLIKDESGAPAGMWAFVRDITDRKRAEESLKKQKLLTEAILDSLPGTFFLLDPQGRHLLTNKSGLIISGYSWEELSSRHAFEFIAPEDRPAAQRALEEVLEKGEASLEAQMLTKDGRKIPFLFTARKFIFDHTPCILGTGIDITARKGAEEALRESEERFRHLAAAAFEAIIIHEGGSLLSANDQYYEMFGYEPEEVLGKQALPLTVAPEALEPMRKEIATGSLGPYESIGLKKDGTKFPMEIRVREGEYEGRKVRVAAIRNITERKQAEEALRDSEARYRSLFQNNHSVMLLIDPESGAIMDANPAACAYYGFSRKKLLEKKIIDINTLTPEQVFQEMQRAKSEKRKSFEFQHRLANGEIRDVEVFSGPIRVKGQELLYSIIHDVTARKRAEKALRESEKEYRSLYQQFQGILNAIPDVMCLLSPDLKIVWTNEASVVATLQKSTADFIGKDCYAARHGLSEPCENCPILRCFRSGEVETEEDEAAGCIWELRAVPIYDDHGEVLGAIEVGRNITERKKMEEALRESQALYQDLVETAQDLIWQCDSEGRYTYLNPAWEEVFGYKIEEMLGKRFSDFQPPENAARDQQEFDRLLAGNIVKGLETVHLAKDGRELHLVFNAKFVRDQDGRITGTRGTAYNITERKQAEEALGQSEARFRQVVESSPLPIGLNTTDGMIEYLNPKFVETFGYTLEEVPHLEDWFRLAYPDPAYRQRVVSRWQKASERITRGRSTTETLEVAVTCKDGSKRIMEIFGSLMGNKTLVVFNDLTERKRMEEALEKRLVALSRPLDDAGEIDFHDLFNLQDIQRIQDLFANSTGVASLITTPDGAPITRPSNFCRLCRSIRQTELGRQKCAVSDASIGRYNPDGPIIENCLSAGLCNAGASITIGGKHVANWLIGQVQDGSQNEENIRDYARALGVDEEDFFAAFQEVPYMAADQFQQVAQALFIFANQLSVMAYQNVQQARFITEGKRMAEALRDSERRLAEIIDFLPDATFAIDLKGKVIAWNRAIEEMTGVKAEDIIGKGNYEYTVPFYGIRRPCLINLVSKSDEEIEKKYIFVKKEGDILLAEAEVYAKGGTQVVWATARPLYNSEGKIIGAIEAIRDITEHKETLEALRESEARFRQVVEFSPLPIGIINQDLSDYVNPKFVETFGYTLEDMPLLADWFRLAYPDPEYRQSVIQRWQAALEEAARENRGTQGLEVEVTCKDGSVRTTEVWGVMVGRKILAFCNDLTERKRAEEERAKLEAQMREVQKLESLGVLAGGIAHDFNNLLMAILGNADLALFSLSPASPARPNVEDILRASQRAADLCRQMLAYSGKGRFVVGRYDLSEIVQEMAQMLEVSVSKKATLRYSFHSELPPVEADATQLRQVIMNLITNASEALGDQSGNISVSTGVMDCDRAYLSESYLDEKLPEGRYVYLEVADTGGGMDKETRRRIFDPFFTTKFTGRGLGLAAVLGIVRGHQGAIKVYSEPGQGTTFKVLLPAREWAPEDRAPSAAQSDQLLTGGTILLIDDDPDVRQVGFQMLKRLGFKVLTAAHGREALEVFRTGGSGIDCVLLDLTMPEMGGDEVFREIRRLGSDVRVIMSSGYNEQDVTQRFVGKGLAGFIQKPYTMSNLRVTLNRVLGLK